MARVEDIIRTGKRSIILLIVIQLVIISCKKDEETVSDNEVLVNHSLVLSYPLAAIQAVITIQTGAYPGANEIVERIKYGVKVFRVNYRTLYKDSVITASGLVCLPEATGSFPVISFQNGTNAYHGNAPSVNPADQDYAVMELMASTGYIVLIPDYIGFGASSSILHPYYHRESTNNAIIDLIRAFREMDETQGIVATANDSLFLLGYSQGGEATISAAEKIETDNVVDMDLIAVSAGAGGYDLVDFTDHIIQLETYPSPMYLPYFVYSQKVFGTITAPLDVFFKQPYASDIPALFNGSYENGEINEALTEEIADLLTENFLMNYSTADEFSELRNALKNNSVNGWNTSLKIRLYHGTEDNQVPPSQSLNLYNEFIEEGSDAEKVQHIPMEGLGHGTGLFPWGIQSIIWFNSLRN